MLNEVLNRFKFKSVILSGLILFLLCPLFGQEGFELISEADIKEYYEKPIYVPDVLVTGSYEAVTHNKVSGFVQGQSINNFQRQKFNLNITSEVDRDVYFFLGLTNQPYLIGSKQENYYAYSESERAKETDSNNSNISVIVDQIYIAYYSNPCTLFKLGIQEYSVGDHAGMIYRGKNSALVNNCTIGTWPYTIGASVIGPNISDSMKWFQLTYPVYNNGKYNESRTLEPSEKLRGGFKQSGLDVELFRINVLSYKTALSANGAVTWSPNKDKQYDLSTDSVSGYTDAHSPYQLMYDSERYLYADYRLDYYGINLSWYYYWYALQFNFIFRQGEVKFYAGRKGNVYRTGEAEEHITSKNVYGRVYRMQNRFFIQNHSQINFELLFSDGNDASDSTTDRKSHYLNKGMQQFSETNAGTFENNDPAFFNAYSGTGDGHSIANLTYYGLTYKYASQTGFFRFAFNVYKYLRTKPVLNIDGSEVSDIGTSLGLVFNVYLKKNLNVYNQTAYIIKGDAYSDNDNEMPLSTQDKKELSHVNFGIRYVF